MAAISYTDTSLRVAEMTSPWVIDEGNQSLNGFLGEGNQSANGFLDDCVILGLNSTVPWDNPRNLVSFEARTLFNSIMTAIFIPILFLVGIPANLLNLAVFFKQGLQERINLCLFTLALADIVSLVVILLLYVERMYAQFAGGVRSGPLFRYMIDNNVAGLYGFTHGSVFLSAVIATERCVCVLFPLKARQKCLPSKVFGLGLVLGVLVIALGRFAVTAMYRTACFYELRRQRLSWNVLVNDYFHRHQALITGLNVVFYGFCLRVGCPVIVLVTTVITGVKLTHIVRWRNQTSSSLSSKEIGVTKMLIALSVEFLVLSLPVVAVTIVPTFEPRLNAGRVFTNLYILLIALNELCTCTSCAANFFVYYAAGTKFRETLHSLCRRA